MGNIHAVRRGVLATYGYYASLHQMQTTAPWAADMLDFDGLNEVIGTPALLASGQAYSADSL